MIPITLIQTDNFHLLRHNATWADANAIDRMAALYRASDYIEAVYVVEGHEETHHVMMAVMMLAGEMLTKPLSVAAPAQAITKEEKAYGKGAVDKKITYAAPSSDPYPLITAILAPIPLRVDAALREASQPAPATLTSIRLRRA